ncbi:MAG: thioredoxin-disulfide reductase [Patescibacteria group bacterium]|jgi:thioredoxin reductase (NADPH)
MNTIYDTIILGSGPAGLTAAIYTARAFLKTLVIKGNQPGGQLTTTTIVENWPGYENGIDGNELMLNMEKQAKRFGAEILSSTAAQAVLTKQPFTIYCGEKPYHSKTVIIATGESSRVTGAPGEKEFWAKGISACATCDGFFFRGKNVVVIGGGDSAMEEANFLTRFCNSVTIIHRRDIFRASKIMVDRVMKNPKIKVLWNKSIEHFNGSTKLESITVKDTKTNKTEAVVTDGAFLAIGHIPNTAIIKDQIELLPNGYIKAQGATTTNIPGVFFAGDVEDYRYRQAVTAAAAGCKAAMDVQKFLEN